MKHLLGLAAVTNLLVLGSTLSVQAESNLSVVYPPPEHQTVSKKIFFIGTAPPGESVFINGQEIKNRSRSGHFAPSLPLKVGQNKFKVSYGDEAVELKITRTSNQAEVPRDFTFGQDSLIPNVDIARLPDEPICFGAIAPADANVSVKIGTSKIVLLPQLESVELPPNSAVLTAESEPQPNFNIGKYAGCTAMDYPNNYGKPVFELEQNGKKTVEQGQGAIKIISAKDIQVVEVVADAGVARTGASTDHSRLTPLPKGTKARVTGKEGEWLRLDYGGWIKKSETKPVPGNVPPQSMIRGLTSRQVPGATEVVLPLQLPVPVEVTQKENTVTLSLHNTTAETDTIRLDADPMIKRLDWQQVSPTQLDYTFELHDRQQWGYDLQYEGTSLIFSLRHPPKIPQVSLAGSMGYRDEDLIEGNILKNKVQQPLNNIKILLDPGHGGKELGAKGPNGYPEKDINLLISKLIEQELIKLGATVFLTREKDTDVSLQARVEMIDEIKPDLAISIHYNALPDSGDAEKTQGISTFWYNNQAHAPAMFLHDYLVTKLNRPDCGTYWNNLALTRPHTAPSILLELGFMINPEEFEWITNPKAQQNIATTLAQGIKEWFGTIQ